MISSRNDIDLLAGRIERAYRRRNPRWQCVGLTPGVWEAAASRLLEATAEGSNIPLDPELFVAVLARDAISPDPWAELTQRRSQTRYLQALKRIVGILSRELAAELRRADRHFRRGLSLDQALDVEGGRISPLACYILAFRANRFDLTFKHRAAAESQHRSCPLYRLASRRFLPNHAYPSVELKADYRYIGQETMRFSLN